MARRGFARRGLVRCGRLGKVRPVEVRLGVAGKVRYGIASLGKVRRGRAVGAWCGELGLGQARSGLAGARRRTSESIQKVGSLVRRLHQMIVTSEDSGV